MTGSVYQVDFMAAPLAGRNGGSYGDAALLLLFHPVHHGGAIVHFAHPVGTAGIEQDTFGQRGLARVYVRYYSDISI